MEDFGLIPAPPPWALNEGLPEPREGETFLPYIRRLGLDPEPLLEGLNARTIVLANSRMATTLQRAMRPVFDRYVDKISALHATPERRRQIQQMAINLFGNDYRRPIL